jgi:dienelactone hydrolase
MTRAQVISLAIVAVLVACLGGSASAKPYAVGERSYTLVDRSRSTPPNGSYAGAPTRTLPTVVLYPARKGKPVERRHGFPLIVFSHGMGATVPPYRSALDLWVRRGYVVVAPTFPLSSGTAPGGPSLADYREQPADVSFVISRVLRVTRREGLARTIDRRSIGVAGHSLGAVTSLALVANGCCRDRRVDAAVAWAPVRLAFAGAWFAAPTRPLMVIHGTADATYAAGVGIYRDASRPKALVTLVNGPHIPSLPPWIDPLERSTVDWFDRYLDHDRTAVRRLAKDANVPGAAQLRTAGVR